MDSPLVYLTLCSIRNRLRVRLRRLREPRYLIGSIVGVAYFAMIFGRPFAGRSSGRAVPGLLGLIAHSQTALALAAVVLLIVVAVAWLWPSSRRPALAFTRADVQFLFTAPIARRRLVRYKVLRSQLGAFFGSALVTLFMRPGSIGTAWTFFVGLALTMAILNLHMTGISLSRAPAGDGGGHTVWRWAPRAILVVAIATIAVDLALRWQTIGAAANSGDAVSELARVLTTGASAVVMWPLVMLVALPLAASPAAFAMALPWTLFVIGLHYAWVLRMDVPFEEASAELSEKLARARKEGMRALRPSRPTVVTPFRLASDGALEIAILWKNLISMGRFFSWTTLLRFVPLTIVGAMMLTRGGGTTRADSLALLALMIAGLIVWLGPQMTRADLRQDLANLAVLKTWPLRGAALVRGEVLAPAALLVALAWVTLVAAAIFSLQGTERVQIPDRAAILFAAMAVTPGLILVQLLIQNALAVTFPAWVAIGPTRRGVDVMGQRMLVVFGSLLVVVLAVLPAALVGGVVLLALRWLTGEWRIALPGLVAAMVLLGEAFAGSELVGLIVERTDVSALDPSDA
jgi:predicted ABC-type exoprotein transport system permease subunit